MGISSYISLLLSLPIGWLADRIQYQKLSLLLFAVVGAMFFCLYFMSCMDCISARILLIAIFSFALPLTVLVSTLFLFRTFYRWLDQSKAMHEAL